MTGTDGARILPFPRSVSGVENEPETAPGVPGTNAYFVPGNTIPTSVDLFQLSALKQKLFWRPVKFTRNRDYPKVVADGCGFKRDSGGFALRRKRPFKYLGYYRRDVITKLEKEYGSKKPRKRKDQS